MVHRTWDASCYLVVGVVLILMNIPMLYVIISKRQLRVTLAVLGVLYAVGLLTGVSGIIKGLQKLAGDEHHVEEGNQSVIHCLIKPGVVLDMLLLPSTNALLCVNSVDRLLVVTLPITYYHHAPRFVVVQLIAALCIVVSLQIYFGSVILRSEHPTIVCEYRELLSRAVHTFEISLGLVLSVMSITVLLVVLHILRTRTLLFLKKQSNNSVNIYIRKQKAFTDAMLVSCAITFLLVTVPNVVVVVAHVLELAGEANYVTCARFLGMLNGVNMVVVMMCWGTDLRAELLKLAGTCFFFLKPHSTVNVSKIVAKSKVAWSPA